MKKFFIFFLLFAAANCEIKINKDFLKNVKNINKRPEVKETLKNYFKKESVKTDLNPLIVGGELASSNAFPYQVVIFTVENDESTWFCGGSIIKKNWILTAAQCVNYRFEGVVVAGGFVDMMDFLVDPDLLAATVNRSHVFVHPSFNQANFNNDIALIYLDESQPVNVLRWESSKINWIPLPSANEVTTGLTGTMSGFGFTTDTELEELSQFLRYLRLPISDDSICENFYGANTYKDSNICVATQGVTPRSTCNGDAGGPLTIEVSGKTTLVGIISFISTAGCESGDPVGFTRVSSHLDWINEISMSPKSILVNIVLLFVGQLILLLKVIK